MQKVTQKFQCYITPREQRLNINVYQRFGFSTDREFVTTFTDLLASGEITAQLKAYRRNKLDSLVGE